MDEQDWLTCANPWPMLAFLRGKVSNRKLRLFACACAYCRCIWHLRRDDRSDAAFEVAGRYADLLVTVDELDPARPAALAVKTTSGHIPTWCASKVPLEAAAIDPEETAALTPSAVAEMRAQEATAIREEQAHFLRDIMGNPFRPLAVDPSWLTPAVVGLAQAAYDQRIMPSGILDHGRLAILANALEDARCLDEAILGHLRGPGQHFRGCHVLDHILSSPSGGSRQ